MQAFFSDGKTVLSVRGTQEKIKYTSVILRGVLYFFLASIFCLLAYFFVGLDVTAIASKHAVAAILGSQRCVA